MELITELRNLGIEVALEDNMLRLTPEEKITPDLLSKIKANKRDIVQALKQKKADGPNGSFYFVDGQEQAIPREDLALIQGLPYVCLKDLPPTALLMYSRVLDERMWLVTSSDLVERLQATGKTVYVLEEIVGLMEQNLVDPESIRAVHEIKAGFPGSMVQ